MLDNIYYTYKNTLLVSLVGGVAGYYIIKNGMKDNKTWALIGGVLIGATVGSVINSKINAKIAMIKNKNLIEK